MDDRKKIIDMKIDIMTQEVDNVNKKLAMEEQTALPQIESLCAEYQANINSYTEHKKKYK